MNKLGLYFGAEKQEALLRGDTSNAVVNRYFIYCFQAVGMYLCEAPDEPPVVVGARYAQLTWETLIEVYRTDDQRLIAQALLLLIHGLVITGFTASAPLYLLKMCDIINNANIQFLPAVYGHPTELSEQVRKDVTVLSQAIYLENYFYLAFGGSGPVMTARIEMEFRLDLEVRTVRGFFVVGFEVVYGSCLASIPAPVQCLPFDHADPRYSAGQGCNLGAEIPFY